MINKRLKDALFTDQWSELFMDALGPFNFVLVTTDTLVRRGTLLDFCPHLRETAGSLYCRGREIRG